MGVINRPTELHRITSAGAGDRSLTVLLQVQLCVKGLSISFSWQRANGYVNVINSAVAMEPGIQRHRWISLMGRLKYT